LAPLGPVDGLPGAVHEVPARALDPDREEADPAVDPVEPLAPALPGAESPEAPDAGTPITGTVSDEAGDTDDRVGGSALSVFSALFGASVFASALGTGADVTGVGVAAEATGVGVTGGVELATGFGV
jgi:hypothetical protein